MREKDGSEQARRLALLVALAVLGLAAALGMFISAQPRDLQPPEDLPRALAIPALYATVGLLALIGAWQRRPAIVIVAGVLCLAGTILSVATIPFAVPALLFIGLGSRIHAKDPRSGAEPVIAAAAGLLIVAGAIAVLGLTETRCWQATGTAADPTYTVIACDEQDGAVGGSLPGGTQAFASGSDGGALTSRGGVVEAVLLAGSLALVALSGRTRVDPAARSAIGNAPPS